VSPADLPAPTPAPRGPQTTFPIDLIAALALAWAGVLAAQDGVPMALRVPLGFALVLLWPGYALVAWAYPARPLPAANGRTRSLGAATRLALAVPASLALTVGWGMLFNLTSLGITKVGMAYALALTTMLFCVLGVSSRLALPLAARPLFALPRADDAGGATKRRRTGPVMMALLLLSVAGLASALVLLHPFGVRDDAYTNLYLMGPGGRLHCLPDLYGSLPGAAPNTTATGYSVAKAALYGCTPPAGNFTVGIVNHEGKAVAYTVKVFWSAPSATDLQAAPSTGDIQEFSIQLGPVPLPGAKLTFERQHEQDVALTPPPGSGLQRVNVHLFKDTGNGIASTPDLFTYFYVNVA
jgi:uncharacterized membrane protein